MWCDIDIVVRDIRYDVGTCARICVFRWIVFKINLLHILLPIVQVSVYRLFWIYQFILSIDMIDYILFNFTACNLYVSKTIVIVSFVFERL